MSKTQDTTFKTADLYFAAYLQTAGVEMKGTQKENGRVFFIFSREVSDIEDLKNGWFNQTAKIGALQFTNSIKALKSIVHMP